MCFPASGVRSLGNWNWDGDFIIHNSIVPSARPAIGTRGRMYSMDVREFLITERNETVRETLGTEVRKYIQGAKFGTWDLFTSRSMGSFDFRANVLASFVARRIKYRLRKGRDPWQFPDETLELGRGDCEDRAFLLASLLLGSGISSFNVRVALGAVRLFKGIRRAGEFDHMWVMYKAEDGQWTVLEPLLPPTPPRGFGRDRKPRALHAEYVPQFLFNDSHLWAVRQHGAQPLEKYLDHWGKWSRFNPKFAGWVHRSILDEALVGAPSEFLEAIRRTFCRIPPFFGRLVDDVDRGPYDPLDHFDNGYIKEGWDRVDERLGEFRKDRAGKVSSFAYAAHAISDFYAHTSYAEFAKTGGQGEGAYAVPCDHQDPYAALDRKPDYSAGTRFDLSRFSCNDTYWEGEAPERLGLWNGQIISGRYAQKGDTQPLFLFIPNPVEGFTYIPEHLLEAPDFRKRGALPHHNEMAVDDDGRSGDHTLYNDAEYERQFFLRRNAAIRHIRREFFLNP